MKKTVRAALVAALMGFCVCFPRTCHADAEHIVSEKWTSFWDGVGHDLHKAGKSFHDVFLRSSD